MPGERDPDLPRGGRGKVVDLTGRRFGLLEVLRRLTRAEVEALDRAKQTAAYWLVRCRCGREKPVIGASLRRYATRSCGGPRCKGAL
jgi:hypothetical protein